MCFSLNVGYSGGRAALAAVLGASSRVASVYTGGVADRIRGGRPQYAASLGELEQQVAWARSRGVRFEVALNAPCGLADRSDRTFWAETADYLKALEGMGVQAIIASHPFIMSLVKERTGMGVVASTICEITTARSARWYEQLGADVIIPSMNANLDLDELRAMKRGLERARLRLMVNEHCLGDCPWRRFHHSHYAHSDQEADYHVNCKAAYAKEPFLLLTNSAIRPEDLRHYLELTTDFKIVGRLVDIETLVTRVQAYERQRYDGNFVALLDSTLASYCHIPNRELDGLVARKWSCRLRCDGCRYCRDLAARIAVVDEVRARRVLAALRFSSERCG